ncbi:hypothetical protein GF319_00365 [Candidatus Bathyarchaeota archaeon]|nr:hypothetical protein [Candidatus Bathyarchaeota archaeon]
MRHKCWLLDAYIDGKDAVLWFKKDDGGSFRLLERCHPLFIAKPIGKHDPVDVSWLFDKHPLVNSTKVVLRYSSLNRGEKIRVIEVQVDEPGDLKRVVAYGRRLREIEGIYNTGLVPIQWHLIYAGVQPSSQCFVVERTGRVKELTRIDDEERLSPPPFTVMELSVPDSTQVTRIKVSEDGHETLIKGEEKTVLRELQDSIQNSDPDIIVTPSPLSTSQYLLQRASHNSLDLRLGRGNEALRGRVLVSSRSYHDMGVAGLSERARFTYAPMGVSHDWEAGKTIDSRQCAEAVNMDILVPPMRGGFAYSSWAWDLIRHDKGGMVFSPKPGLHVNVAALDFESMFPNIIVRKNVSYETVTEDGVNRNLEGFLGRITEPFLSRRIRFKHLREKYPEGSREWLWCQQRQSTLKLFLVVYYGYSGCYANRFANVRVFQEINRQARDAMVTALQVAQREGYDVVYGPFDSLFVKHPEAGSEDFKELAAEITEETQLPMSLDRHFKYLVLLNKTTDPIVMAANRYYGKLTDGSLFYRGIEIRRHDTPPFIHNTQEEMIRALLRPAEKKEVLSKGLDEAQRIAGKAITSIRRGRVDPRELVISKRLRKDLKDYTSNQPHIVAAMLGEMEEMSRYILVNTECENPFMRVMPESMIDEGHKAYDKRKYASMMRRAAWNILRPFIPEEKQIGKLRLRESNLDKYLSL